MPLSRPAGSMPTLRHNLPAEVTSFIGRERERTEIKQLLLGARLLTVTGPGGSGKTRLALQIAAEVTSRYPDGVWLVQLAPLVDSRMVSRAVATALGVRGSAGHPLLATLATALATRKLLLVLDNCEHLIGACAQMVETLLRACPQLRVVATSREPLRIAGEMVWRMPALELPDAESPASPEALLGVEAVSLFEARARARQPDFVLTDQNAPAVVAICRGLEGLPLGIELAAAQMSTLSPQDVANRLSDTLRLLARGHRTVARHETLRATLDWSHALLNPSEQILFRRLAIFAGGFGLSAVEAVCNGEGIEAADVLPLLAALVEKSLVEPHRSLQQTRYRVLEPVRQYAWERLMAQDEVEWLERRHAQHFTEMAEAAEPALMSGTRALAMEQLATEQDNLRRALAWSRSAVAAGDREMGMRLAGALLWFWNFRGEVSEGLEFVEAVLRNAPEASPRVRAWALYGAGEMAWLLGQNAVAREYAEESIALWRALGEKRRLAYTLQSLPMAIDHPQAQASMEESLRLFEEVGDEWGIAVALTGLDLVPLAQRKPGAEQRFERTLGLWRALGDDWGTAQMLNIMGDIERIQGRETSATAHYQEALTCLQRHGMAGTVPSILHNLGYLALHQRETRRALRLFRESLALFRDQGDLRGIADCLDGVAGVLSAMNQPERAARLFGAADALRSMIGAPVWPTNVPDRDQSLAAVRDALDEEAFATTWAAGSAIPWEQAVTEVLAPDPAHPEVASDDGELTAREREVAALVAQGLTNRQIGSNLFITEGTARLHVKHILRKLGFTSRAQVAGWAIEHGLAPAPTAR